MKMSHIDEGILHAYLDGEVSEGQKAEIDAHLSACAECSDRLEAAKRLIGRASGLLAELEPGAAQPPAWPEIEERAAARSAETGSRPFVRPWLAWAASIVLAFGVGWLSSSSWLEWSERPVSSPEIVAPVAGSRELVSTRTESAADMDAVGESNIDAAPAETEAAPSVANAIRGDAEPQPASPQQEEQRGKAEADQEGFLDEAQGRGADQPARLRATVAQEAPAEPAIAADEVSRVAGDERQNEFAERKQGDEPDVELVLPMAQVSAEGAAAEEREEDTPFFAVQPEEAAAWLGVELRTLPDLELQRIEVGPGNALQSGLEGLPAVRLVYLDAADHEIVLIQQRVSADPALDAFAAEPVLAVEPSGRNVYRWRDSQGYLLTLAASVSGDSLRALAERIR
jgi:hypothetical protein